MKVSSKLCVALLLTLTLSGFALTSVQAVSVREAQDSIENAYKTLVDVYNSGADVSNLIGLLNQAINLTVQAHNLANSDPQQSQALVSQAQIVAENVTTQASAAKLTGASANIIGAAIFAAILVICGCLIYFFGPNFLWKAWFKLRKNYYVAAKSASSKSKSLAITWEQVCAAILGLTIIIALVATAPFFLPKGSSEQFSELGVLGPNMKIGDYPKQVVAGQPVSFFAYVGNQMGQPMYYEVMVKLGDNHTATNPAPIDPAQGFIRIVPYNGTWTFPLNVTLTQAGLNQRILFELWIYNQTISQMQYTERWGQVWLNVTAPAT
jgi:hypothetical protein